jgi:hypothetical protein
MGGENRFRLQFKFWLDVNKPDEEALAVLCEDLKRRGLYTKTIRDGINLVEDLRNGHLDVLFALYPWVKELIVYGQGGALARPASPMVAPSLDELIPLAITQSSDDDATDNFLDSLDSLEF